MDVNDIRDLLIRSNGLKNTDEIYTFYYDETNNIRKLHLNDSGLNVEKANNFVLAGIVHKGLRSNANFSTLLESLKLQKSTNELKLKHIAKGGVLDMLKSEKLLCILQWLKENEFYLHYFNMNIIYWSVIDIVDSMIGELNNQFYMTYHMSLKSDFYEIANNNSETFLKKLNEFNYPDVPKNETRNFCHWLIDFVSENGIQLPDFRASVLEDLIRQSLKIEDMPFISGFHGRELISDFMVFYLRNLYLFKNSRHIFDEEKSIQDSIKKISLTEKGSPICNYNFVKSHNCIAIQVSDVIAGFLGKYFTYLKDVSLDQLTQDKSNLALQQKKNLHALKELIDASDEETRGFFNTVSSEDEQRKNNWFLHGVEMRPV